MRGLQAKDTAVAGRDTDAATTVGAESYGDESGAYGVAASSGGATGVIVSVVWVERGAVYGVVVCGVYVAKLRLLG